MCVFIICCPSGVINKKYQCYRVKVTVTGAKQRVYCQLPEQYVICILLYILFLILRTAYCVFYIVCFYRILGLLLIFYICRILLIQLLGCHIEINACLVVYCILLFASGLLSIEKQSCVFVIFAYQFVPLCFYAL